jgi:CheY-like chemotaxis protein
MFTFLIADDSKMTRITLQAMLESLYEDSKVYLADDGVKAVDFYAQFAPDVVFMDISMPNRDGLEATQIITKKDKNAKVIMMTSHLGGDKKDEAKKVKSIAYLQKPLNIDEIEKILKKVLI